MAVTDRVRCCPLLRPAILAALGLITTAPVRAQVAPEARVVPTNQFLISGYGTIGYAYRPQGEKINEFTSNFNPIFLFQFQDRILFEAELEFELEEGVTETGLEYAQFDYLVSDNLALVGGKFLIPFGVFGERLHPTWINKFATAPPIFGHHVSEFGAEPLLPIISDIGVMARGMLRPGPLHVALNGYATQGAAAEPNGEEVPEMEFPASSSDNNTGKLLGGRLDVALPPWFEVNFSYFNGDYDDNNVLDFTGLNVAAEFRRMNFELRGEYVQTRQEIEQVTGFPVVKREGFYGQASYRFGSWEPVVRWTQVFDTSLDGAVTDQGAWQAGFGLDYWFSPSIALMAAFELNRERGTEVDNDRIIAHIAYGF